MLASTRGLVVARVPASTRPRRTASRDAATTRGQRGGHSEAVRGRRMGERAPGRRRHRAAASFPGLSAAFSLYTLRYRDRVTTDDTPASRMPMHEEDRGHDPDLARADVLEDRQLRGQEALPRSTGRPPTARRPPATAPRTTAITPSSMNGSWSMLLDAPTSRMMPVSRRRLKAASRIVVARSRTAATSITAAMQTATSVASSGSRRTGPSSSRWSLTSSTPRARRRTGRRPRTSRGPSA